MDEYEFYERVENGDMNWLSKKFLALANPKEESPVNYTLQNLVNRSMNRPNTSPNLHRHKNQIQQKTFYSVYKIDELVKWFKENNISTIVRLNNKIYDRNKFIQSGIDHVELYFPDGTTPPEGILLKFLELCESRPGPIAVHCKAGLGRTGSLIASYFMKHYKMTASEVIGFLRIIRPGSVVGPQQNWLQRYILYLHIMYSSMKACKQGFGNYIHLVKKASLV